MELDPKRQSDAAARARELRDEAWDLRKRAASLEAKARAIEYTWDIRGSEDQYEH